MISSRPCTIDDIKTVLANLSDVTKGELDRFGAQPDQVAELAEAFIASGPAETMLADDEPLFILGHYYSGIGFRHTWCFSTKAIEKKPRETALAAAEAVQRLLKGYPSVNFVSVSYSVHPKRDRMFHALGFHKVREDANSATFFLLPEAATKSH
jgi:hypothetical protein